jgi:hypothetical protein
MRSSRPAARAALFLGALAVLAIPAGVGVAQILANVGLLQALYVAVPVAAVLGLLAVGASRRARFRLAQSLHPESRRLVRAARVVAWAGLYAGVTGGLALGVYAILTWAQT